MTSAPVTDVGLQMPYMKDTGGIRPTENADFMGTLKSAIESQSPNMNSTYGSNANLQSLSNERNSVSDEDIRTSSSSQKRTNEDNNQLKTDTKRADDSRKHATKEDEVDSKTVDTVDEKAESIVEKVAESMDVSEEDVIQAMEVLGLGLADLFDPATMTDLVTKLSGNQDAISLVTDENLYQTLETLQDFVTGTTEDLMEELDLSQEALDEVLTQTEELMQHHITGEENQISSDKNEENVPLEGMKDFKTTVTENGEQITVSVKVDDATGAQVATYQSTGESQTGAEDSSKDNRQMGKESEDNSHHEASLFTQNLQMNNQIEVPEVNVTEQVPSFSPEARNIADQIMESMKANMRPEVTELEMNLHPASLGNVRVNLTASGGQVSAQFVAQNETVRAAIESQIVQLTNQLEEQGVKIEAVEVTLASHQFESRSEGNQTGDEQSSKEQNKPKVGRVRRLDMSTLEGDDDLEDLEESDRIAADMMARNGNTVDYTA